MSTPTPVPPDQPQPHRSQPQRPEWATTSFYDAQMQLQKAEDARSDLSRTMTFRSISTMTAGPIPPHVLMAGDDGKTRGDRPGANAHSATGALTGSWIPSSRSMAARAVPDVFGDALHAEPAPAPAPAPAPIDLAAACGPRQSYGADCKAKLDFNPGELAVAWTMLSEKLADPHYALKLDEIALPTLRGFNSGFNLDHRLEAFVESPLEHAMSTLEALSAQVSVDPHHPLFLSYRPIANHILNFLNTTAHIPGWQRIPNFATGSTADFPTSYYQGQRVYAKSDAERDQIRALELNAMAHKGKLDTLQFYAQALLNQLLVRVEWVRQMMQRQGLEFDCVACLKILAADKDWLAASKEFMRKTEEDVTGMLRDQADAFGTYRDMQRRGVDWPHSLPVREQIEKEKPKEAPKDTPAVANGNGNGTDGKAAADAKAAADVKGEKDKKDSDFYIFSPMLVKRDRCVCPICDIQIEHFRCWNGKKLNRTHDWEKQHPYYEAKLKAGYKPLYMALVWDETHPRPYYFWALNIIRKDGFNPNEIIDPMRRRTALHCLAESGDLVHYRAGLVSRLMFRNADPSLKDRDGLTAREIAERKGFKPLYFALFWDRDLTKPNAWERDWDKIRKIISDKDFDPNEIIDPVRKRTALHYLAELGMLPDVRLVDLLDVLNLKSLDRTRRDQAFNNKAHGGDVKSSTPYEIFEKNKYGYPKDIRDRIASFFNPAIPQVMPQPLVVPQPSVVPQSIVVPQSMVVPQPGPILPMAAAQGAAPAAGAVVAAPAPAAGPAGPARAEPKTEPMDPKTEPMDPKTEPMVVSSADSSLTQPHPPGGVGSRR